MAKRRRESDAAARNPAVHPGFARDSQTLMMEREFPVGSTLAPALLLSMPQLVDPNFSRTVILLCKHDDEGAFGLVMNRPLVTSGRVVVNLDPPVSTERELEVWIGGPVEPGSSWMLVGSREEEVQMFSGLPIIEGVSLSTSPDLLR